ncbi:hypothetical protein VTK56DRAFT_5850 [Thermocarpiscus australiensis]
MSIFGVYAVVRICVGAATPNWLRETLGVRRQAIDKSIGLSFDLAVRDDQTRLKLGPALGIQSETRKDKAGQSDKGFVEHSRRDVYTFDRHTARHVDAVRVGLAGTGGIYTYAADPYSKHFKRFSELRDFYGLLLSMLKLVEVFSLYKLGARWLAWTTGASWAIFLLCTITLIILGVSHDEDSNGAESDVLAGQLPSPSTIGGERCVLLGIPSYTRNGMAWTMTWIIGAMTSLASVIVYYILLGQVTAPVFYTWSGFQFAWLIARIAFFHLSVRPGDLYVPSFVKKDWKQLSPGQKIRVRGLAYGLSTHMLNLHPRKRYAYDDDATEIPDLGTVVEEYPWTIPAAGGETKVHVACLIGDTMLASVCWAGGAAPHLTGFTVYDSCIVQLRNGEKVVSVPAARVLTAARPTPPADEEAAPEPLFPPRGSSNTGPDSLTWYYWIPCGAGLWLQVKSRNLKIRDERSARVMTDEQISAIMKPEVGELFISLRDVGEVKEIVKISREACQAVAQFMS